MSESAALAEAFDEVLNGNNIDALKTALQNLMVLFEQQNRNYLELKEQVTNMRLPTPSFTIQCGDSITIDASESKPNIAGITEGAYEMLAAIRMARKQQEQTMSDITETLKDVIQQEDSSRSRLAALLEKQHEM